ncbi:N-acetyl-gamma-glutamyl-phosphate reductase [Micrococcus sp. FDAARGOS_333]|uniref:N-acetyl-gamma-glutamyl-phosphate reductase n=1 Tax=Micrococcus sp. FDAARGOS_333 TaxID=1930558 RepID=UPI000B4E4970|nr:N-acetyl-gamma-glutamyl-phosphate reductase [Micrococcus sp. FDAARGOS_333]PNL17684.1 N-acetyl-gamma-glutamyl-phosphate reductase [Micrococcus sp. FDAARGOS_333]
MTTLTVGVVGATGAAGGEACRLLLRHPNVGRVVPFARAEGELSAFHPRLTEPLPLVPVDTLTEREDMDAVLLCTPTGEAMQVSEELVKAGTLVVDLSADHRFNDPDDLQRWHGVRHPSPQSLSSACYGLTELARDEIASARLIANPGCFAITAELALMPLAQAGLLPGRSRATVFAVNGMTGAGSTPRRETAAAEASATLLAYGLDGHRHAPEIEQALRRWGGSDPVVDLSTAHADFRRGIHLTASIEVAGDVLPSREDLLDLFCAAYGEGHDGERFVQVIRRGRQGGLNHKDYSLYPQVSNVAGTNNCQIGVDVDLRTRTIKVVAVSDNLGKGAAGGAVQNLNVALGLPESAGLEGLE